MPRSSRTRIVWSPSAVSVASMTSSYGASRSLVSARRCRGGSHTSTRPVPSHPLVKKRARNSPPRRRSPSNSPSQRARRRGSVSADHRSSMSVSKRSSMRTTPLPSADRRLPRIRLPASALLVIWCSFVRVSKPCHHGRPNRARAERWAWSLFVERAHLKRVVAGDRMRGRELDRLLTISATDDVDAGDEPLGGGERPVAQHRLPVADADRGGRVRVLQRVPQDVQAAYLQVLPPGVALLHHFLIDERRRRGCAHPPDQH